MKWHFRYTDCTALQIRKITARFAHVSFSFISFYVHFSNEVERLKKSLTYLILCDRRKNMSDLKMSFKKILILSHFPCFGSL